MVSRVFSGTRVGRSVRLAALSSALVLFAVGCAPRPSYTRVAGAEASYDISCGNLDQCVVMAQRLCPLGYQLKGSTTQEREDTTLATLALISGGSGTEVKHERTDMRVECELSGGGKPSMTAIAGIGGFKLGAPARSARSTCRDAGGTWRREGGTATCTASPDPSLLSGEIRLFLVAGQVAAIVIHDPAGDPISEALTQARAAVVDRFGDPVHEESLRLARCQEDPQGCGAPGTIAEFVWGGPEGERLVLVAHLTEARTTELALVAATRSVPGDPTSLVRWDELDHEAAPPTTAHPESI